jgi:Glycosyltransferase sugar-binding region containing DXD motif
MTDRSRFCGLLRNLILALALYGSIYILSNIFQAGFTWSSKEPFQQSRTDDGQSDSASMLPSRLKLKDINPHANWFNRPMSLAEIKYDYLGQRPDVDTIANLTRMAEKCRGSFEKLEKMRYTFDCLRYLTEKESDYYYLPEKQQRASVKPPKYAEYRDADGRGNTLDVYPSYVAPSESSIGQCSGPVIPYHTYWAGPATWRVDLFIKAYFYTQNIPCTRLWIWLDVDKYENAIDDMLHHDPVFAKWLPFVKRGDISLHVWRFPSRVPIPSGKNINGLEYYKSPGRSNSLGEVEVAEDVIRDAHGQEWIVLDEKRMTFLPVAVSDAVRFIILHIHGGAYFDMDVIMLKDLRPLFLGQDHSFAERWGQHPGLGDYNTCVLSLSANTSLSTYLLRGGIRMGMNFHPRIIGRMAAKEGRNWELKMLESAVFDPIWFEWGWDYIGRCTVPCFRHYSSPFRGKPTAFPNKDEWESFDGPQLQHKIKPATGPPKKGSKVGIVTTLDKEALGRTEYRIEEDNYPPTNRTMDNFFKGSFSYHAHGHVSLPTQPIYTSNTIAVQRNT